MNTNQFQVIKDARIDAPKGFYATGVHCGIKRKRKDLGMITCTVPAQAAAVYTTNAFRAAPLKVTEESMEKEGILQAVLVNSGNANACTGKKGLADAYQMRADMATQLRVPDHYVGVCSTGIIGESLPMDRIQSGIHELGLQHKQKTKNEDFAEAILTTDTLVKKVQVELSIDDQHIKISGVAKGSGMINPNMATMLGFITSDIKIESVVLQSLLWKATEETFNMITVDGDSSTNDTVIAMASGLANNTSLTPQHKDWHLFVDAFTYVCRELAKKIARDGEGASRLIVATVRNAHSLLMARQISKAIISSNLVKTAIFGADANWGRIMCAIGYGDKNVVPDRVEIKIGDIPLVKEGQPLPFIKKQVAHLLTQETIPIDVDLHLGKEQATAWGCDLTYEYIKINANYRT
ncbi:bifunctional glutamate N-acetyltransferase/amino-acid acetyltransferase ArgJ [Hazenella sp. IB182357]|uniref:Arginine biosynthesis bifunctional protein ArgJ n=1 Tax=Polycladospora coralii TaxID=2771432 RepID=A0A926N671_9BACL|nr:bifunctional glutamate N-acetyltransferase/amino-acid acetyltransferase ArgJ [Polycladospora coralii]MBD1372529.1 bifunctional glutamate N-acetyltransferase/amino-acid acetyltransferase ArgJ [Polycladospora coralii]MBS7531348.1 bifunctional glutamate N-acetyltransferase/amino-acid acetyltransferase ArgJ [Polycladospora coralii]